MQELIDHVARIVHAGGDERTITSDIAAALRDALVSGLAVPKSARVPDPDRYVMYPLYIAPDESPCIASAVWDVGQGTPVHGHETWGVVGIYSGEEHEISYHKPTQPGRPLEIEDDHTWGPRDVTVCCTTDDDVHQVSCAGAEPVVGIHIYGGDIGKIKRRSYNPETGEVSWFVSEWGTAA